MKLQITLVIGFLLITAVCLAEPIAHNNAGSPRFENRCGWFANPTPANAWFYDRDGEWIIGVQGGHQAEGDWPDVKPRQWVRTNVGDYGYGCSCMRARVNKQTHEVLEIKSSRGRTLAQCRNDPALKKWARMFK
jgi:uncharacterized protein DUF4087